MLPSQAALCPVKKTLFSKKIIKAVSGVFQYSQKKSFWQIPGMHGDYGPVAGFRMLQY
jgi:hypothetical protein